MRRAGESKGPNRASRGGRRRLLGALFIGFWQALSTPGGSAAHAQEPDARITRWIAAADAAAAAGRPSRATAFLRRALRRAPGDARLAVRLAELTLPRTAEAAWYATRSQRAG